MWSTPPGAVQTCREEEGHSSQAAQTGLYSREQLPGPQEAFPGAGSSFLAVPLLSAGVRVASWPWGRAARENLPGTGRAARAGGGPACRPAGAARGAWTKLASVSRQKHPPPSPHQTPLSLSGFWFDSVCSQEPLPIFTFQGCGARLAVGAPGPAGRPWAEFPWMNAPFHLLVTPL